jgi:hypothetical protein
MRFNNVLQQEGRGYDKYTGVFTASITGIYNFSSSGLSQNNDGAKSFHIWFNDLKVCEAYNNVDGKHDYVGCSANLKLIPGDRVYVKKYNGNFYTCTHAIFSGVLLHNLTV